MDAISTAKLRAPPSTNTISASDIARENMGSASAGLKSCQNFEFRSVFFYHFRVMLINYG